MLGKINPSWHIGGVVSVNDTPLDANDLSFYRSLLGFVPQDDVCHRELSVYDNILYSANIRLPSNWSKRQRQIHVDAITSAMQLDAIRDVVIGDERAKGISGGQRKRVNIALELAAAPLALLLDEPTSGLDSTTSRDVCNVLKEVAQRTQITIAMVIHQPRAEIWNSLDEILLLAPGGRTCFQGPQRLAQQYFEQQFQLQIGKEENPADAILDAISERGEEFVSVWSGSTTRNNQTETDTAEGIEEGVARSSDAEQVSGPLLVDRLRLQSPTPAVSSPLTGLILFETKDEDEDDLEVEKTELGNQLQHSNSSTIAFGQEADEAVARARLQTLRLSTPTECPPAAALLFRRDPLPQSDSSAILSNPVAIPSRPSAADIAQLRSASRSVSGQSSASSSSAPSVPPRPRLSLADALSSLSSEQLQSQDRLTRQHSDVSGESNDFFTSTSRPRGNARVVRFEAETIKGEKEKIEKNEKGGETDRTVLAASKRSDSMQHLSTISGSKGLAVTAAAVRNSLSESKDEVPPPLMDSISAPPSPTNAIVTNSSEQPSALRPILSTSASNSDPLTFRSNPLLTHLSSPHLASVVNPDTALAPDDVNIAISIHEYSQSSAPYSAASSTTMATANTRHFFPRNVSTRINPSKLRTKNSRRSLNPFHKSAPLPNPLPFIVVPRSASFFDQFFYSHLRSLAQQQYCILELIIECGIVFGCGIVLGISAGTRVFHGIVASPYDALTSNSSITIYPEIAVYIMCSCVGASANSAVFVFGGDEQVIYWRETAAGHNPLAYFLGRYYSMIYRQILASLHISCTFHLLCTPIISFGELWFTLFLFFHCCYGVGCVVSQLFHRYNSPLVTIIIGVIMAMFNGLVMAIPLGLRYLFPSFYVTQLYFSGQTAVFENVYQVSTAGLKYGYRLDEQGMSYGLLILLGFLYAAIGYGVLRLTHREKQQ